MSELGIFNDFCAWWPFWWIAPFILGLLLGSALWGKYKRLYNKSQEDLSRHKSLSYELEKSLKQCRVGRKSDQAELEKLQKENKEMNTLVQNSNARMNRLKAMTGSVTAATGLSAAAPPSGLSEKDKSTVGKEVKDDSSSKALHSAYDKLQSGNLQIIEGIGPKMEALLKENGIKNWSDLAAKSLGELRAVLDKYGGRYSIVNPSTWPKQASLAKKQKWQALIKFQSDDGSSSKLKKIADKLGL